MRKIRVLFGMLMGGVLFVSASPAWSMGSEEASAAKGVIRRLAGNGLPPLSVESLPAEQGRPVFETSVKDGVLHVKGSSGVAACRGFYDWLKSGGRGIASWSGNRVSIEKNLPNEPVKRVVSPFRDHYYMNVVTYGYTMPYWDWKRWEKEIDWMALHGIDMPLALVANEAISARVWKRLGLTDSEIAEYFVGPAHLPWMRMGNISGIDGPLTAEWHKGQINLQHRVLKRMRELGMKPICPGFAGFVPPSMKRVYPDIRLVETRWSGGAFRNWMISPDQELFSTIGRMFVEEWEKEFGRNTHYLADSFNEMEIPFPPKDSPERYSMLADYGDKVYKSISAANPDAVWVMQGWMFGYQRNIWDEKTLAALVSKVPDGRMMLLDLAVDYSKLFWQNGGNWEFYKGFFGKDWVYSVIPNMGGKTAPTGVLSFYANGHTEALRSPNRGNLTGFGMAPEGTENNEVLYELLCDAGWSESGVDLDDWLVQYARCRYGKSPARLNDYWDKMEKSVYGSFTDHPRFGWQFRPGGNPHGSVRVDDTFYSAVEDLAACAPELKDSPLYRADLAEMAVMYAGGKLQVLLQAIDRAYQEGEEDKAVVLERDMEKMFLAMDRVLETHPVFRLQRWLDFARGQGATDALKDDYEKNARRIVTIWGPPVDDYSARVWSGLIRDYYLPRWKQYFASKRGEKVSLPDWEKEWVEKKRGLSAPLACANPVQASCELIRRAAGIKEGMLKPSEGTVVGAWSPAEVSTEWKELSWDVPVDQLKKAGKLRFSFVRGNNRLEIGHVSVEMDGATVFKSDQQGVAGTPSRNHVYDLKIPAGAKGNNSCRIKARVRTDGSAQSFGNVELLSRSR